MKSDIVLPTSDPTRVVYIPSLRWTNPAPRIAPAPSPAEYPRHHTIGRPAVEAIDHWIRGEYGISLAPGRMCASAYYLREREDDRE